MPSVLTGASATVTTTEGAAPVLIAPAVTLSGDGVWGVGAYLTVSLGAPGDYIALESVGSISVSGNDVYFGIVKIGVITTTAGAYRIDFTADASAPAVEAVIEGLGYRTTTADPAAHRDIVLNLVDVNGQQLGLGGGVDTYAIRTFTAGSGSTTAMDDGAFSTPFIWTFSGAPSLFSGTSGTSMALHSFGYTAGTGAYATNFGSGSIVSNFGDTRLVYARGDLYGDATDAIVTGNLAGVVRLYRHNPGQSQQSFTVDVGDNAAPTLADIDGDGDGDRDLIVGAADGHLYVFANTGTATDPVFEARTGADNPFDAITTGGFSKPAFFDVDHDGDMDLVLGGVDGTLRYFQNSGGATPTFTEQTGDANPFDRIDVGRNSAPFAWDMNGDGRMDLIVGAGDGTYTVLESVGSGGVAIGVDVTPVNSLPTRGNALTLTIAEGGTITINTGILSFTDVETGQNELVFTLTDVPTGTVYLSGAALTVGSTFTFDDVRLGRITYAHDGSEPPTVQIGFTVSDEDGGVLSGQTLNINITPVNDAPVLTGATGVTFDENVVNGAPQRLFTGVVVNDVEGNFNGGKVVVGGLLAEDRVTIHNEGDGAGQIGVNGTTVSYGGVDIGTISVAGDQTLTVTLNANATNAAVQALVNSLEYANVSDTPTATRDLYVNVVDSNGGDLVNGFTTATVASATAFPTDLPPNASPELADMDGDGDLDLLMGLADGTVSYYENTGSITAPVYTEGARLPGIDLDFGNSAEVETADMDNDGDLDVFISVPGAVRYFRNDGDATTPSFTLATSISTGGSSTRSVSVGDMDGDGDLDLLVGALNANMRYIQNVGSATAPSFALQAVGQGPAPYNSGTTITHPVLLDLDADGDLDLFMGAQNGTVTYRENTGTATTPVFGAQQLSFFGASPAGGTARLDSADIDGDGDQDILIAVNNPGLANTTLFYVIENTTPRGQTVTVNVTAQDEIAAQDDAVSTDDNAVLNGSVFADNGAGADTGIGILVTAVNGQPASVGQPIALASGATLTLRADGTFTYNPGPLQALAAGDSHVETFTYTITGGDTATVTLTVNGVDSDDVFTGTSGNDSFVGGVGVDTVIYSGASSAVRVDLRVSAPQNTNGAGTDTLSGFENLTGSAFNDTLIGTNVTNVLTGGLGSDVLLGLGGDDILIGGAGAANTLQGGLGDDVYVVDAADTIVELAGQGRDRVETTRNVFTLGANVEDLTFTGTGNFTGYGNAGNNVIIGGAGDDILVGGAGADTLNGGGGIDMVTYAAAAAGVTASLTAGAASSDGDGSTDVLTAIENLTGSAFDDTLTGAAGVNYLIGGAGDDTINGRGGNDWLYGGDGEDTVSYADATSGVAVHLYARTGTDGEGGTDVITGFENVTGSAFNDLLVGDTGDNVMRGGLGRDVLLGREGSDWLYGGSGAANQLQGGAGDDVYFVDANDTIIELAGEGHDYVTTTMNVFNLAANVEDLEFVGTGNFTGTGNASDNEIYGNVGDDILSGAAGQDMLNGGEGADILLGGDGNDYLDGGWDTVRDILIGGAGDDTYILRTGDTVVEAIGGGYDTAQVLGDFTLAAGVELEVLQANPAASNYNTTIVGNELNNGIFGGDGDNVLRGLAGNDRLSGGYGADRLEGGDGDDILIGGYGDDQLFGGSGSDTAWFSYARSQYTVVDLGGGRYSVTHNSADQEGVDILEGIELVRFSDGAFSISSLTGPMAATATDTALKSAPMLDDDFLPGIGDQPLVLPAIHDALKGFGDALVLPDLTSNDDSPFLPAHLDPWGVPHDESLLTGLPGHDGWLL
jgi:VCBS repeat-containing protein